MSRRHCEREFARRAVICRTLKIVRETAENDIQKRVVQTKEQRNTDNTEILIMSGDKVETVENDVRSLRFRQRKIT